MRLKRILICFDISNDKRRRTLTKILKKYAYRVQHSVFECWLTNKKCNQMTQEIQAFYQPEDLIRIYQLPPTTKIECFETEVHPTTSLFI